jgi:hypothetical protein
LAFELHLDEDDLVVRLERLEGFDVGVDLALLAGLFRVGLDGHGNSVEKVDESTAGGLGGGAGGILGHDFFRLMGFHYEP